MSEWASDASLCAIPSDIDKLGQPKFGLGVAVLVLVLLRMSLLTRTIDRIARQLSMHYEVRHHTSFVGDHELDPAASRPRLPFKIC